MVNVDAASPFNSMFIPKRTHPFWDISNHIVDQQNPAPVDMSKISVINIQCFPRIRNWLHRFVPQFQAAKAIGDISTLRAASGTSELTAQFKSCSAGGRPSE